MFTKGRKTVKKNLDEGLPLFPASNQLSATLLSHHDLDQILDQAVRQIKEIFGAKSCGISLLNDEGILEFKKGLGLSKRFQKAFDSQISPKLTYEFLNRIYPKMSNDILVDYKKCKSYCDLLRRENIHKEMGISLKVENKSIGILNVGRDSSCHDFSKKDLRLLNMLGTHIALGVGNTKLYTQFIRSYEVHENLIDGISDSIVTVDMKRNITYCNKATEILTGYTKKELIGKHFSQVGWIKHNDIFQHLKSFKELLRGKRLSPFRMEVRRKDGKLRWYEVYISRIKAKSKIIGFQVNIRDIAKRKKIETALIRKGNIATQRARLLNDLRSLDRIDDILTRVCETIRDSGLFQRAVMTLHKPGGKICHLGQIGLPSNAVKRARQAPPIDVALRSRITSKRFRISDSFFIPAEAGLNYTKTGRYIPEKTKKWNGGDWQPGDELFIPLREFSGEIMGYLSVDTPTNGCRPDVDTIRALEMLVEAASARVREIEAREALKRERDFSKSILETANSLILCLDADAQITAFNQECERVTGYRREEVLGKRWHELFLPPSHRHAKLKSFANWVRAHPRDQYEGPIVTKSGEIRTILWSNTAILGSGKKDVTAIAVGQDITERKQAEGRLHRSEERFRLIAETSLDYIFQTRKDGNTIYCSPSIESVLGYTPKERQGKDFTSIILPSDLPKARASFKKVIEGETVQNIEINLLHKNGKTVPFEVSVVPISENKEVTRLLGIARDITDRKRVEETLRESEKRYRLLADNVTDIIWTMDMNLRFTYISPSVKSLRGYTPEEALAMTLRKTLTPASLEVAKKVFAEEVALERKKHNDLHRSRTLQLEQTRKDGSTVWTEVTATFLRDQDGRPVGILGVARDITERKRAEETLRESEETARALLNAPSDVALLLEPDGTILALNEAAAKTLGKSSDELVGSCVYDLFPPDVAKYRKAQANKAIRSGKPIRFEDERKGSSFDQSAYPIFNAQGKVVRLAIFAQDITERKRAEEALRESEEKFRVLAERSPNMIFINKKGKVIYANKKCEEIMGYKREEFYSPDFDFLTLIAPEHRKSVKASLTKHVMGKEILPYEYALITKKGRRIEVILSTKVISYRGEKVILGIITDITERKRAEETLRIERDKLETVTQNAGVGIAIISKDYRTLWANQVLKQIFGDVEGEICYSTYNQRSKICPGCGVREIFKTGQHEAVHEQVGKDTDGKTVWSQIVATPIKDKEGNITAALEVVVDITERKRTEEALRESEERFRTISTTAKDAILMIDNKGNISYWNPAAKEIFGYSGEEVIGKELHILLAPMRYHETYRKGFSKFKKAGQGVAVGKVLELEAVRKDGTEFPIELSLSAIKIKDQWHAVGIVRDITERKRAEEALQENEERYRSLFEDSPISLWEEDFSDVKAFIDGLGDKGVKDFRKYFEDHPKVVAKCATMVKIIDVNNASLDLFKARSKEELQSSLSNTFSEESYDAFREELVAIAQGKNTFETETITQTLKGDKKHVFVRWSVAPGYEKNLSKVLVSIGDITELKRAREQNLLLETSKALSQTLKLDQVLKIGTERMAEVLKADRCSVALLDKDTDSAAIRYLFIKKGVPSPMLPSKRTPPDKHFPKVKEILLTKGYLEIKNTETISLPTSIRNYCRMVGTKSFLVIPLIVDKKLFGVFHIGSVKKLRSFSPDEISLAQTVANQIAVAIQNAVLIEDLREKHSQIADQSKILERQYEEQAILMKISRALSQTLDLDQVLQISAKETAQALQIDRCATSLAFPEKGYAEIMSIYVKEGKPVSQLLGYKLYGHYFPQAREMFEKRKLINVTNTNHLPDKSFAKKYFTREGIKSALFVPMVHGKKLVGFFVLSTTKDFKTFTGEEERLAQTIADQVAVAIENARLLEVVRKNSEDLKALSAELMSVQEDERKKIAQELHDEIGQTLFAMKMNLDITNKNLPTNLENLEDIKNRLGDTENLLSETIDRIRNLTTNLRPSMLDDFGLIPALKWYIDNFSKRTNIRVNLKTKDFKLRLSSKVETTLYRILQEALTNVAKHAQADEVSIVLSQKNSFLSLSVQDNGVGFEAKRMTFTKDRLGLFSMKERVELLNGEFEIRSRADRGTKLSVKIPLVEREYEKNHITFNNTKKRIKLSNH